MGTIRIDAQTGVTYLSYQLSAGEQMDHVVKGMLDNNTIPGILQPLFSQKDDDIYYRYDISSFVSLRELLKGGIQLRAVIKIMLGISSVMDQSMEYLIPANAFLLDTDYIFVDDRTYNVGLVCIPALRETADPAVNEFFMDLLTRNKVNTDASTQRYYSEIINYLNENWSHLSLRDFKDRLQRYWDGIRVEEGTSSSSLPPNVKPERGTVYIPQPSQPKPQSAVEPAKVPEPEHVVSEGPKKGFFGFGVKSKENKPVKAVPAPPKVKEKEEKPAKKDKGKDKKNAMIGGLIPGKSKAGNEPPVPPQDLTPKKPEVQKTPAPAPAAVPEAVGVNFGKTVFLSGMSEGTQILDTSDQRKELPQGCLVRASNGDVVTLSQSVLRIGRDRNYADYCIRNEHVSSRHARIEIQDGHFVVVDTESSNGTYVNGRKLKPYEACFLQDGDSITFGGEQFTFQVR